LSQPIDRVPTGLRPVADGVIAAAEKDPRFLAVIVAGSVATGTPDEYSDLDLVLVCTDTDAREVLAQGKEFAAQVGPLLVVFTGEHVGEPRLLIALYGPPVIHVDLKFIGLSELDHRVEDGVILWQRDEQVHQRLQETSAAWPQPDPQWIEDRFWVWVHYIAVKLGRGELFEAVDGLGMLRGAAIVPLIVSGRTDRPAGVRRIEELAPELVPQLNQTVASPDRGDGLRALRAAIELYRQVRPTDLVLRTEAEQAVIAYVDELATRPG
jgi:hypothetical protein